MAARVWPGSQMVLGSGVNRSALTGTSFASGWRGKTGITTNLRAENIAASPLMDAVPQPNSRLWRDEAGPSSPPLLDSVGFGPASASLPGETLGEQSWGASSHFSHTFGWEMCAGSMTRVWRRNWICCRKKKKKKAGIFAKSLATSCILIINFYSEYNLFALEETQFFLSSIINIDQFCTSFFFSFSFFFTRQILVSQIPFKARLMDNNVRRSRRRSGHQPALEGGESLTHRISSGIEPSTRRTENTSYHIEREPPEGTAADVGQLKAKHVGIFHKS